MKLGIARVALLAAKNPIETVVAWASTVAFMFVVGMGCSATGLTPEQAQTVRSYEAEQLLCVDKSKTKEESVQCRCEVKAKYGRPCELPAKDGGAP